jgi:hypothetical protein
MLDGLDPFVDVDKMANETLNEREVDCGRDCLRDAELGTLSTCHFGRLMKGWGLYGEGMHAFIIPHPITLNHNGFSQALQSGSTGKVKMRNTADSRLWQNP